MSQEPREVFISYHADSAGDAVRKICAALEGAGITCWYAPRNVGSNYASSIVEAIRGCRVFLLILNEKSNISAHVLNEINCAFDRFKDHEDITLLPFRIDKCMLSDDIYYYLGRIHIMDGAMPPELVRIQELVDRISNLLGREQSRTALIADAAGAKEKKAYRLIGTYAYPDNHFVGRKKELEAIHTHLSGVENKLFLVGMGGIGKSEIARMYLKQHAAEYDVILWISFEESLLKTLASDVAFPIEGLSRSDYPEDGVREYFERKLRILKEIADRKVLIVLDNFDVPEDPELEAFCSGTYSVLFTTRFHEICGNLPEVEICDMEEEEDLLALFRAEYTRALDEAGLSKVKELLKMLNGHPLSIRLVASAMQSRRLSPEKMEALLQEGAAGMARENMRAADLIFGRLRQVFQLSTLNEEEQYLLKNLALISLRGIPVETFFDWCGLEEFDLIDDLIRKSWVIHNPATDEVHLHPLVAELMAEQLEKDAQCCEKLVHRLVKEAEKSDEKSFAYKQQLFSHINTAFQRIPKTSPLWKTALAAKAKLTKDEAMYRESAALYEQLLEQTEDLAQRAGLYGTIAHCLNMNGNPEECLEWEQKGYELVKDIPVEELTHEQGVERVFLLNRLAETTRELGDYDDSLGYARQALALAGDFARVSPQKSIGWTEYHLAFSLLLRGDLDESEAALRHGIKLFEEVDDIWSAGYSYDMLSQVLMRRGSFDEALKLNEKARNIVVLQYGEEHADTAANLEYRGNIYREMKEHEKAAGCYRQAAEIFQKRNCSKRAEKALALMEEMNKNDRKAE